MKKITLLLFMFFILFASCDNQYSEDETQEEFFCGGACNKTTNIMVGSQGQILKNANGSLTWKKAESHTDKNLLDAYYSEENNCFYVAGQYGTVAVSDDNGITWSSRNTNPEYHLFGIAANKDKIMTVGKSLVLLFSKDGGREWERLYKGVPQLAFYDIAFGNDFWIAVGDYSNVIVVSDKTNKIVTDTRAEKNKRRTLKSVTVDKVNNLWVAVGHEGVIFTSNDNGTSWQQKTSKTTDDLLSVAFNGKRFLAVGTNGVVLTSKDGATWNKVQINNNSTFRSVSCTDTHWLAITIDGKKEIIEDSKIE